MAIQNFPNLIFSKKMGQLQEGCRWLTSTELATLLTYRGFESFQYLSSNFFFIYYRIILSSLAKLTFKKKFRKRIPQNFKRKIIKSRKRQKISNLNIISKKFKYSKLCKIKFSKIQIKLKKKKIKIN